MGGALHYGGMKLPGGGYALPGLQSAECAMDL